MSESSPSPRLSRTWWRACLALGVATFAFSLWFLQSMPLAACGEIPTGMTPLLAFQLARSHAELDAVFGALDSPCRDGMVAAFTRLNRADLFGFIPTYGAFLAFFFVALRPRPLAVLGLGAVFFGLFFDVLETATQIDMARELPASSTSLAALVIGSRGKFLFLTLAGLVAGTILLRERALAVRVAGGLALAGAVAALVGLITPGAIGLLTGGTGVVWLVMLLVAGARSLPVRS